MTRLILALLIAAALGLWARSRRPSEVVPPYREDDDGIAPMDPRLAGLLG